MHSEMSQCDIVRLIVSTGGVHCVERFVSKMRCDMLSDMLNCNHLLTEDFGVFVIFNEDKLVLLLWSFE